MKNEFNQIINYPSRYFEKNKFYGVVLIDADIPLSKIHYLSFEKANQSEFPIAFITKKVFNAILAEIDTPMDLCLYLKDRKEFIDKVFYEDPAYFLDLNSEYELDLIGLYKINENKFDLDQWRDSEDKKFWEKYKNEFAEKIKIRELDNQRAQVVDAMLDFIITQHPTDFQALEHAWEIGVLTRRARGSIFAEKIENAVEQISSGQRRDRHFAFFNQSTMCWDVFYFNYGSDEQYFQERARFLSRMKMKVERFQADFKYSVFCFAFRKSSSIISNDVFDYCYLWQEDADNYPNVSQEDYQEARQYFVGRSVEIPIEEFPKN